MADDTTRGDPEPGQDDAFSDARLLEEQQARIAALRAAVLSGRVPDEDSFDYARFFGGPAKDGASEG